MQSVNSNPFHTVEGVLRLYMLIQGYSTVRELFLDMQEKLQDSCIAERTLYTVMNGTEVSIPVLKQLAAFLHNDKMPVDYTILTGLSSGNKIIRKKSINQCKGALIYMAMA